jgi:hypothetical protein
MKPWGIRATSIKKQSKEQEKQRGNITPPVIQSRFVVNRLSFTD